MMKRLFIGIGFTDEPKDYFKEHQQIVGKYCETAGYTAYDNFHLTLKFLGMMNDSDIVKVIDVMKSIKFEKFIWCLIILVISKRRIDILCM